MGKGKQRKTLIMMMVLALSLVFAGLANAAPMTMMKDGKELVHLRQAAEMYGYSIAWDSKEKSVTLMYTGSMMKDDMMKDDMMMEDDMMMKDDTMMEDDMMMESGMKPMGETIKLRIGSKKAMINGKEMSLDIAPALHKGSTYVSDATIMQYMKPAEAMKKM